MGALNQDEVTRYYRWLLDREPEPEILAHYQKFGIRRPQLISMIAASGEFAERMRRMSAPNPHPASPPEPEPDLRAPEGWWSATDDQSRYNLLKGLFIEKNLQVLRSELKSCGVCGGTGLLDQKDATNSMCPSCQGLKGYRILIYR